MNYLKGKKHVHLAKPDENNELFFYDTRRIQTLCNKLIRKEKLKITKDKKPIRVTCPRCLRSIKYRSKKDDSNLFIEYQPL